LERSCRRCSMKAEGSDVKVVVDSPRVVDYEWSPDGKWIVYAQMDGSFASELYIIPAAGGKARNVTRFATENVGVTWSGDGKKLCFLSNRRSSVALYVLDLHKESAPGATGDDIDWDDIHRRAQQVTTQPVSEGAINSDGTQVAFASQNDLWLVNVSSRSVTRVTTGRVSPTQITWSRRNSSTLYFRDG